MESRVYLVSSSIRKRLQLGYRTVVQMPATVTDNTQQPATNLPRVWGPCYVGVIVSPFTTSNSMPRAIITQPTTDVGRLHCCFELYLLAILSEDELMSDTLVQYCSERESHVYTHTYMYVYRSISSISQTCTWKRMKYSSNHSYKLSPFYNH